MVCGPIQVALPIILPSLCFRIPVKTNGTKTFGPKKRPVTDSQSFLSSGLKKQVLPFTLSAVSMPAGLPGPTHTPKKPLSAVLP